MANKIRIGVMSDLHLEFEPDYWARIERLARHRDSSEEAEALQHRTELRETPGHPEQGPDLRNLKGVDLLLLAGDIRLGTAGIAYADAAARYLGCPVYACCGNHEPYGFDLLQLIPALRQAAKLTDGRVTFLEKERVNVEVGWRRVAILGALLWTDYRVNGDERMGMLHAGRALNDHCLISYGRHRFTPAQARSIHFDTRAWLGDEIPRARDQVDVVIVVTHHAPIPDANPPQYRGGELSPAFVSDMRSEILQWQPDLWVWGHTHYSMRDRIGQTECASAQRGYLGIDEGADRFVPMVIEI